MFDFNALFFVFEQDYNFILKILLSTSAIAVPIFLGFVVQQFISIRREQISQLKPLGVMQDRLKLYREAMLGLGSELLEQARSKGIDVDFSKDYFKAVKKIAFWEKKHAYVIDFIRALYRFGEDVYHQEDVRKGGGYLRFEEMKKLKEAIEEIGGILTREKHYKHVLNSLGIDYQSKSFDTIEICATRVKHRLPLRLQPDEDYLITKLSFWQHLIEDAISLMAKMEPIYVFVSGKFPKKLIIYTLILAIVGIFSPLLILVFNLDKVIEFWATYFFITAFIIFSSLSFYQVWHIIISPIFRDNDG